MYTVLRLEPRRQNGRAPVEAQPLAARRRGTDVLRLAGARVVAHDAALLRSRRTRGRDRPDRARRRIRRRPPSGPNRRSSARTCFACGSDPATSDCPAGRHTRCRTAARRPPRRCRTGPPRCSRRGPSVRPASHDRYSPPSVPSTCCCGLSSLIQSAWWSVWMPLPAANGVNVLPPSCDSREFAFSEMT